MPKRFAWFVSRPPVGLGLAALLLLTWMLRPSDAGAVDIGRVADFPRASVTHLWLQAAFDDPLRPHYRLDLRAPSAYASSGHLLHALRQTLHQQTTPPIGLLRRVPVFLARADTGDFVALYDRDPLTGCRLAWQAAEQLFSDGCSYSAYGADGRYLRGPAARDMDRFGVVLLGGDRLAVDVRSYQAGRRYR